ncbi:MAG: hypothetical protein AABX16_02255 [Nanoarchaeota archaeon]
MKKIGGVYFFSCMVFVFILLFSVSFISAIELIVSTNAVQNSYIIDLDEPAVYELTITNNEDSMAFEIYSLVGIDIFPKNFYLAKGETKKITIQIVPQDSLKEKKGPVNFIYKIKNANGQIQEERLSINVVELDSAISVRPESINPQSEVMNLVLKNMINFDFDSVQFKTNSAFFSYEDSFSIGPRETISLQIPIDKEKAKMLDAGKYLFNSQILFRGEEADIESEINFVEREDIESLEKKNGFFVQRTEISKKNMGNVPKMVTIIVQKNMIAYLFTTLNQDPTSASFKGFHRVYLWEKELDPSESLEVVVVTNWLYPFFILLIIVIGAVLIRNSLYADLFLRKKVSFIKTKGGQFALKVSVIVKAKRFVEHVKITDRLPNLVELYEKFGMIKPDRVDLKNKRIEWNIATLNQGESRIFTYIIYSKIGVVGTFELPNAHAMYEKDGKLKEILSNRSFFVNEPKKV